VVGLGFADLDVMVGLRFWISARWWVLGLPWVLGLGFLLLYSDSHEKKIMGRRKQQKRGCWVLDGGVGHRSGERRRKEK
jgi:hypothetical protein